MNRSNKQSLKTKRGRRIAKLPEKGRSEREPRLSDAELAKGLSERRGKTKRVKRGKRKMTDIKERREAFGYSCCDSEGLIKGHRAAV